MDQPIIEEENDKQNAPAEQMEAEVKIENN